MESSVVSSSIPITTDPPTPSTTASPPPNTPPTPITTSRPLNQSLSPTKDKSPSMIPPSPCPSNPGTRYSPLTNLQHSPTSQYQQMDKVTHSELGGSVRHLEAAMTRHLPQQEGGIAGAIGGNISGGAGAGTGFSTIQWAGGQEPSSSALLRQIYAAKRETVIRTSRDSTDNLSASVSNINIPPTSTTSIPPTGPGILPHTPTYPGYHISPPSSVSPERLKAHHPCDPYTDLYSPLYSSAPGPPKNPYDALRSPWYPA